MFDRVERMQEHDDVEREVVADGDGDADFHCDDQRDRQPHRYFAGDEKAQRGEQDVAHGIEDAVAAVAPRTWFGGGSS
jgi:hypothetical protein